MSHLKSAEEIAFANSLIDQYQGRLQRHSANAGRRTQLDRLHESQRKLWLDVVNAQRMELTEMREADQINDEVHRVLESDLDLEEGAARNAH